MDGYGGLGWFDIYLEDFKVAALQPAEDGGHGCYLSKSARSVDYICVSSIDQINREIRRLCGREAEEAVKSIRGFPFFLSLLFG